MRAIWHLSRLVPIRCPSRCWLMLAFCSALHMQPMRRVCDGCYGEEAGKWSLLFSGRVAAMLGRAVHHQVADCCVWHSVMSLDLSCAMSSPSAYLWPWPSSTRGAARVQRAPRCMAWWVMLLQHFVSFFGRRRGVVTHNPNNVWTIRPSPPCCGLALQRIRMRVVVLRQSLSCRGTCSTHGGSLCVSGAVAELGLMLPVRVERHIVDCEARRCTTYMDNK